MQLSATRDALKPPPVEPAHAPTNMSTSSTSCASTGQSAKSTVANPVVEMIELTWNSACRSDSPRPLYSGSTHAVMISTAPATMPRNQCSSSLLSASRTRRMRIR